MIPRCHKVVLWSFCVALICVYSLDARWQCSPYFLHSKNHRGLLCNTCDCVAGVGGGTSGNWITTNNNFFVHVTVREPLPLSVRSFQLANISSYVEANIIFGGGGHLNRLNYRSEAGGGAGWNPHWHSMGSEEEHVATSLPAGICVKGWASKTILLKGAYSHLMCLLLSEPLQWTTSQDQNWSPNMGERGELIQ